MYIDAFAIPANAKNVDAALRFIDFTLRPDIGVQIAHGTGFAIANAAAVERLEPELRNNHIVYPPPEVRERFQSFGSEPIGSSPDEFATQIKNDIAKWAKTANVRAD